MKAKHSGNVNIGQLQVDYMLKTIADMYLDGNLESGELSEYFTYKRSFNELEYIRAAYQTTTKPQVWKNIKESGDDYSDSYYRDEYNIIYVGSEIANAQNYGSYM